jgi:hypothetical protein
MDNFRYATWELDAMVSNLERPNPFLLRMFFGNVRMSEAATIEWDVVEGGKRMVPFVSPLVAGRPMRGRGSRVEQFKPAYVKPSGLVTPQMGFTRRPGEAYGGQMTPKQRVDRILAEKIADHEDMLDNRLEWMAAKALVDGSITVSGEDYPSVEVNFGRHSDLEDTLSSGARWSQTTGVPLDDIENMAIDIRKRSYGAVADTVVMDGTAWSYFRARMASNVQFDSTLRLGNSSIDSGPRNNIDGEYVGKVGGRFDVYVYDGHYEDEAGVMQPYLPAYTALVASRAGLEGRTHYGAVQDLAANLVATRMFHKTKEQFDPSGLELVSQSAPLVAPRRPNASARITVHQ